MTDTVSLGFVMAAMYPIYLYYAISFSVVLVSCELSGDNICRDERDIDRCCTNYIEENGKCIECPPGTSGGNCSNCPTKYYGRLCLEECNCSINQTCDNVRGCICEPPTCFTGQDIQTTIYATLDKGEEDDENVQLFLYKISAFTIGGLSIVSCSFGLMIYCHRYRKRKRENNNMTSISTPNQNTPIESEYQEIRESRLLTDCKTFELRVEIPDGTYNKLNGKPRNKQCSDDSAFLYDTMQNANDYSMLSFKSPYHVTSAKNKQEKENLNEAVKCSCTCPDEREYVKLCQHIKTQVGNSSDPVLKVKEPEMCAEGNIKGPHWVTAAEIHKMGDRNDILCEKRKDYKYPYKEEGASMDEKPNNKFSDGVYSLAQGVESKNDTENPRERMYSFAKENTKQF